MYKRVRKTQGPIAAVFLGAGMLFAGQTGTVFAADLGGNCCADLEERVAELEATTVRKKARQLSMTVSGRVHSALIHWDDGGGDETNFQSSDTQVGPPLSSSRVVIDGRAKLRQGWEAGYRIGWEFVEEGRGSNIGHDSDAGDGLIRSTSSSIEAYEAYWFIRSDRLGALSVGTRGQVHGGAAKVDITGKTGLAGNPDPGLYGGNIRLRDSAGTSTATTLATAFSARDGDNGAGELSGIRYDTPNMAGFIVSADWTNENSDYDQWGLRLSFARQMGDFKVAGAVGYVKEDYVGHLTTAQAEVEALAGSMGILHAPSGIFVNFGAGSTDFDTGTAGDGDAEFWYVTAGLHRKMFDRGITTFFGQFYNSEGNGTADTDADYWGFGINQNFAAANLDIYAGYRQYDAGNNGATVFKGVDVFVIGGIINF